VATKERKKNPVPPFITSKLQQASRFPVKKTMMVAQQLYEGIELPGEEAAVGLITYMRTDSVRVADQALLDVREHIGATFGADYLPAQPNTYRVKQAAQDAHEAIRPTSMAYSPEQVRAHLTPDQFSLYRLIWNRFVASQMVPATFDDTTIDITALDYLFRAKGSVPKFAGWLAVYGASKEEAEESERTERPAVAPGSQADSEEELDGAQLPVVKQGQTLTLKTLTPEQKFTQPPPHARFAASAGNRQISFANFV
jgi:DNA topoisomerase-1